MLIPLTTTETTETDSVYFWYASKTNKSVVWNHILFAAVDEKNERAVDFFSIASLLLCKNLNAKARQKCDLHFRLLSALHPLKRKQGSKLKIFFLSSNKGVYDTSWHKLQ